MFYNYLAIKIWTFFGKTILRNYRPYWL